MTRVFAVRLGVVYFSLYALATQLAGGVFLFPGGQLPALGTVWPLRELTLWSAEHLFGLTPPLVYRGNSGDTAFHWVQGALLLAIALVTASIWTAVDRREHVTLRTWFRLFVRFALAAQMFYYGLAKIIPTQFPPPGLVTLIEPVGALSLSDLLWTFIGASTPYQVFTGCAEVAAGALLLAPQTTPLGALLALIDMIQVFVLNMTYDFGLKQISFHLILFSVFLLAPDLRRLGNVLVLNRTAAARSDAPLFATSRTNRVALYAQLAFGVYLIAMFSALSLRYYKAEGGPGAPKSPLYGIWNIEEMSVDGQTRPAALNDYERRWRRVIFDQPRMVVIERLDDSLAHFGVTIDTADRALSLSKGNSRTWTARLTYERPADDRLRLVGTMDGHTLDIRLQRVGLDTFRLLNSTFRWVRPPDPYAG